MVLHAISRSDEAYKWSQASILSSSALKQWEYNDIPSIAYFATIIVLYDQKNRKFIDSFIVNAWFVWFLLYLDRLFIHLNIIMQVSQHSSTFFLFYSVSHNVNQCL